jgi:DNA polymerase-3 subunit beta
MKFVIDREDFHQTLQRIGSVTGAGEQQHSIYSNVRLVAEEGRVVLSGFDAEGGLGLSLVVEDVAIEKEGAVLIPHGRLSRFIGATPDEKIAVSDDDGAVQVETSDGHLRILGEDPTVFPDLPPMPADGIIEVDADVLEYMIRRTKFAAAPERGRYALNGVLLVVGRENSFEMVAADGSRLAMVKKKATNPDEIERSMIVMTKGVDQLARLADFGGEQIRFTATEKQFMAENSAGRLVCQLIEGQFPNYQEVIPPDSKIKVDLPVPELHSAVRRVSYVTTDETNVVDFQFADNMLTLVAESPDVGRAEVKVACEYDANPAVISFNPNLLEDMLGVVVRDTVKMRFSDSRSPCVLKVGMDYTYVISPVIREDISI